MDGQTHARSPLKWYLIIVTVTIILEMAGWRVICSERNSDGGIESVWSLLFYGACVYYTRRAAKDVFGEGSLFSELFVFYIIFLMGVTRCQHTPKNFPNSAMHFPDRCLLLITHATILNLGIRMYKYVSECIDAQSG